MNNDTNHSYHQDGFIGPLDIITPEEAHVALKEVERELSKSNTSRFKLHLVLPSISKIAHHPKLIKEVKAALNSDDIMLWSSDINIKRPNSPGFYAPHQDCTYAGLSPSSSVLTAWIALSDPVGVTEGCLSFHPTSHKSKQLPHFNAKDDDNLLVMGQYIDNEVISTLNKPICIELKAGQATLHSFDCVHSSAPNKSDKARVGLALRYMTSTVRQTKPIREMATWICGEKSVHFDVEPRLPDEPSVEELERGRDAQNEGLMREDSNYFYKNVERGSDAQKK